MATEARAYSPKVERLITGLSVPIFKGNGFELRSKPLIEEGKNDIYKTPYVSAVYASNTKHMQAIVDTHHEQEIQFVEAPDIPGILIACSSFVEIDAHKHPNSNSSYLSEMRIGNDIFLLSTLAPGKWTSGHFHARDIPDDLKLEIPKEEGPTSAIEYYNILYGMAILHHVEGDKGYVPSNLFSIEPGVMHRMQGGPKGFISAIWMKDAALYPKDLRHIHY